MVCSGSHPCFVNNDCNSGDGPQRCACGSRGARLVSVAVCGRPAWAPTKKAVALLLSQGCVPWASHERRACSVSPATAAVAARREGVRGNVVLCYVCCYGCCARQQRVNVSAAPRAPCIFSPLSARTLPTLGSASSAGSVNSKTTDAVTGMKNNANSVSPLLTRLPNKMSLGLIRSERSWDTTYRCTLYVYSTYIFENLLSL